MDDVERYLQFVVKVAGERPGYVYNSMEHYVLTHGQLFERRPLPRRYKRMPMGHCFRNAFMLASDHRDELRYVEGYALSVIPMHHAWCVDGFGIVVDPTWEDDHGEDYHGVIFDFATVKKAMLGSGSVLNDFKRDHPLLKGRPVDDDIRRDCRQRVQGRSTRGAGTHRAKRTR